MQIKLGNSDILVVDDEEDIRSLVSEILTDAGYEARQARDSDSALNALADRVPNAVILDIWLRGSELDGMGILEVIAERYPWVPVIMISGHGNIETAVNAIKIGAYDFIEKPFKSEELLLVVNRAIESSRLKLENIELKSKTVAEFDLMGNSGAVSQVRQAIEKVAATNSRVLISGPSGSGKEIVARLIHQKSRRESANFVVLNSAGLSAEKIDEELFGVEDGGFQTSGARKTGALERAHKGTLFIDEIAEIPMQTQGKLLRVLQEGTFSRVGSTRQIKVDVRIISASTRNLKNEIYNGRVREDLFYRLNVVPVEVPPLSQRKEDIPDLCRYFLKRVSDINGLPLKELGEDTVAILQSYEWPGNVRQLRNVMEWLLIMSPADSQQSNIIRADMLPPEFVNSTPAVLRADMNMDIMALPLREAREIFEREYLLAQVSRFGGNISRTSAFIGMERSALHRKLKSLGIGGHQEEKEGADEAMERVPEKAA